MQHTCLIPAAEYRPLGKCLILFPRGIFNLSRRVVRRVVQGRPKEIGAMILLIDSGVELYSEQIYCELVI